MFRRHFHGFALCALVLLLLLLLAPPSTALHMLRRKHDVNYSSNLHAFQYYSQHETVDNFPSVTTTVRYNAEEDEIGINAPSDYGSLVATVVVRAMQYQNGWDQVEVRLEPSFYRDAEGPALTERIDLAYEAAGIAEGFATFAQMESHLSNLWDGPQGLDQLAELAAVQDWVKEQIDFLVDLAADPASGAYGRQLYRLLCLLDGVTIGFNLHEAIDAVTQRVSAVPQRGRGEKRFTVRVPGGAGGTGATPVSEAPRVLDFMALFMMNAQAEIGDIVKAVHLQRKVKLERRNGREQTAAEALQDLTRRFPNYLEDLHCSALVKVVPDEDLFVSHVTWNSYESMTRQHKTYVLEETTIEEADNAHGRENNLTTKKADRHPHDAPTAAVLRKSITMSGYPGLISSLDDWYQTHQRLVVTETTLGVYNTTLFEAYLQPRAVPTFLRALLANCLSSSAPSSWFDIFGRHNSGTYNNQWMVLSMGALSSRPHKSAPLPADTFWVGEQLPGPAPAAARAGAVYSAASYGLTAADLSAHLSATGYWASYNLPFFTSVDARSGTAARRAVLGRLYSYNETPRARIFAREQGGVRSLADMMQLMRQNEFATDAESLIPNCAGTRTGGCSPAYSAFLAVASRGDLNPSGTAENYGPCNASLGRRNHGATDAKITSWASMVAADDATDDDGTVYVSYVVNAPTTSGGTLPPFRWRPGLFDVMPPVWGLPTYQRDVFVRMISPGPARAAGLRPTSTHHYTGFIVAAVCAVLLVVAVLFAVGKARQARQYAMPQGVRRETADPLLA